MNKRLLSIFLALCMVLTMLQVSAMAEETHRIIGGGEEISAFASLAQTEKTVTVGTSVEDLELPETLTATEKLSGTTSQFNVYWGGAAGQAVIRPGVAYTGKKQERRKPF